MTASNVQSLIDATRQSHQFSATIDGLLKNVYIKALNNTTFHATPLMEMFGDFGGKIDFAGNQIIKAFKHQGAGGFGGISEGGDFVKGRNQKGFQGSTRIKFLNAFFSLTGPAARTVRAGEGAYVDSVSSAMDDTLKLARQQMERICGGHGDGELARYAYPDYSEAAMVTGEYLPNTDIATSDTYSASAHQLQGLEAAGGYSPAQWLQPGLRVQIVPTASLDGTVAQTEFQGIFEVGHVDYEDGTFSLKYVSTANLNLSTLGSDADWSLVFENAYGQVEAAGTVTADQCLELNGLYNLISDGVDHSGETDGVDETVDQYAKIWGRDRSLQPHALKSTVKATSGVELDEELLIRWVLDLVNIKQNIPNVLVTDPLSRLKYFSNRKEDRRFDMKSIDSQFGFRSIGVVIDQYSLDVQSLTSLVPGTLFMINTNDFKYAKASNGFEWIEDGGQVLRNKEGSDNIFASAINYCEFVCENPNGQLKATGLAH